jgi:hypothetical protein
MWINKLKYLYEKKLDKDRIKCLEMTIEGYKTQLKEARKVKSGPVKQLQDQHQRGLAELSRLAGMQQASPRQSQLNSFFGGSPTGYGTLLEKFR